MSTYSPLKRIKVLTSYAGHARWNYEVDEKPLGFLARCQVEEIPSPYMYSPTKRILNWNGRAVILFETSHRRYEIFEVPQTLLRFNTEAEAIIWNTRYSKKVA